MIGDPDYATAYAGVLTDDDIVAVLSYIISTWPTQIRAAHSMTAPLMIRSTLLALAIALTASAASSHQKTTGTTPAQGATVAEAPMLHIVFGGPMRVTFAELTLDGDTVSITRPAGMDMVEALDATPDAALVPGDYRLEWRGLAEDGHPMQGELSFTVAE